MKARIRNTNIEVDVRPFYSDGKFVGFSDNDIPGYCTYTKEDLIFPDATDCTNIDWSSFRREAAKDILPAVIAKKSQLCSYKEVVKEAIEFADELIRQLKGGKK